jgi:DNA-binding LacI/PurR family transcriptional regulator
MQMVMKKEPSPPSDDGAPKRVAKPKRVQMTDIARLAGVSASTVSRALSGSALIPEETRQRIRDLATSMNYQVNIGAANLRKRDVNTVGLLVLGDSSQAISDPFMLTIVGQVADALDARGVRVLLQRLASARYNSIADMYDSGQAQGLIVVGQAALHTELNALAQRGVPLAVWGAQMPDALYPIIGSDNERGGYLATQRLLELGCQHIAYLGDTVHPEALKRYQGYLRAMKEYGQTPDPRLHQSVLFGDARLRQIVSDWLTLDTGFDGVFAASDVAAITVISALSERGVAIPGQVKVVGYDDIPLARHVHPALTTVRQPTGQAGQALVNALFDVLAGRTPAPVELSTELVIRETA